MTKCLVDSPENVKLLIEKKGFIEILKIKEDLPKFDGMLEVFFKFCDAMISDTSLISATIECQIKKIFYDEEQN